MLLHMQRSYWDIELCQYTFNIMDRLKDINCPVQLLYGVLDKTSTIEDGLKLMKAIGSNASMTGFAACDHFPHVEEPETVKNHIMSFVWSCEEKRPSIRSKTTRHSQVQQAAE